MHPEASPCHRGGTYHTLGLFNSTFFTTAARLERFFNDSAQCARDRNTAKQFFLERFSTSNNYNEQHTGPLESSELSSYTGTACMMLYSLQGPQNKPTRFKAFMLTINGWPITRFDFAWHTARHGNGHTPHLSYQPRFFFFNVKNSGVHFTGCSVEIMNQESCRSIVQTIHKHKQTLEHTQAM